MQRTVFQDGRVLRTADFVNEQSFHLAEHRLHNRSHHVWGIGAGLQVVNRDGELAVVPGHAVDGFGRDVVLDSVRSLDLRAFDIRGVDSVDVWLVYAQVRYPGTDDGVDWVSDGAAVELEAAADIDPRQPPGVSASDLMLRDDQQPPDDPARRWPIYLGRITRDLTNPDAPPIIDLERRPYIGLVGSSVETPTGHVWLEVTEGNNGTLSIMVPDGSDTASLTITNDGGVVLNDTLTIDGALEVHGGALVIGPDQNPATLPSDAIEWSLSHADDGGVEELRVVMPHRTGNGPHNRLVVGIWQGGVVVPKLVVDEAGTVVVAGNLIVNGRVQASSIQEAELSDAARAYLAGTQMAGLLSLFGP